MIANNLIYSNNNYRFAEKKSEKGQIIHKNRNISDTYFFFPQIYWNNMFYKTFNNNSRKIYIHIYMSISLEKNKSQHHTQK